MQRVKIEELTLRPFHLLDREWALLVGGRPRPNPMTVSWGGLGTLWNRPVATVYVRPTRFTFGLLNEEPSFTLNFMPEELRPALDYCGANSGAEVDKWAATGLQPVPSATVPVPQVADAQLVLECRVLATLDLDPARFLDPTLEGLYPRKDYHRVFLGAVLAVWAGARFLGGVS